MAAVTMPNSVAKAVFAYAGSAVLSALVISLVAVYVFHWYDAKFRGALDSALQVQLIAMAVLIGVGTLVLAITLGLRYRDPVTFSVSAAWIAGVIYPIGAVVLGQLLAIGDPESLLKPLVAWTYMIVYSAVVAFLIRR